MPSERRARRRVRRATLGAAGVDAAPRGARRADRATTRSDWRIDRIAPLERAILRVALYEILHRPDVPDEVAIDEAVETAKLYCGAEAPGFVNGILGGVAAPRWLDQRHRMSEHERRAAARPSSPAAGGGRAAGCGADDLDADEASARGRVRGARLAGGGRARPAGTRRPAGPGAGPGGAAVSAGAHGTRGAGSRSGVSRRPARARRATTSARCASPPSPATAGLDEAMRYSLLAGGKRIRPVLALAHARARSARTPTRVLPTAAAIELIHTYSLIHDDLPAMDDDDLRRGRPTCHIAYGENVAILAGDGLFAEAYRLVLERQEGEPERVLAALREISDAIGVGGMVGGQYVDVAGDADLDADGLRHMHELKTGQADRAPASRSRRCCSGAPSQRAAALEPLRRRARRAVPDRRRHPRRDRLRGGDGQATGSGRAARQAHLRERVRAGAGAGARGASPTRRARAALDAARRRRSPATPPTSSR